MWPDRMFPIIAFGLSQRRTVGKIQNFTHLCEYIMYNRDYVISEVQQNAKQTRGNRIQVDFVENYCSTSVRV